MVTTPDISEYRTRLTGLLGLKELSDAIARELYSRNLHSPPKQVCYSDYEMANLLEEFHDELLQSDRDLKTIDRYWQIICIYRKWLDERQPSVETAKRFISWLRNKGYRPRSVRLYYHVIKIFRNWELCGLLTIVCIIHYVPYRGRIGHTSKSHILTKCIVDTVSLTE
jgi:hypothetical protein